MGRNQTPEQITAQKRREAQRQLSALKRRARLQADSGDPMSGQQAAEQIFDIQKKHLPLIDDPLAQAARPDEKL